jgi:hypothetical protein
MSGQLVGYNMGSEDYLALPHARVPHTTSYSDRAGLASYNLTMHIVH